MTTVYGQIKGSRYINNYGDHDSCLPATRLNALLCSAQWEKRTMIEFDNLRPIVSGLAGAFIAYLLSRVGAKPAQRIGHRRVLQFGTGYRVFAALSVPLTLFVLYAASHSSQGQLIAAALVMIGFVVCTSVLVNMVYFTGLAYDDDNFYYSSRLFGTATIPWADLNGTGYSAWLQSQYLKSPHNGTIWVSEAMRGFVEFTEFLEKKRVAPHG
jgi:hypothetical protein